MEPVDMANANAEDMACDVVIAGCGVAGLYAALNLPADMQIVMLSKGSVDECDSMLAQGGICVLPEGDDYEAFFIDTLRAGHFENRRESVDIMIRSSRTVIDDLLALGVDFERKPDGGLDFTREGAHSRPRIAFHADITGKEITTKLLDAVRRLPNVKILEHVAMVDILLESRDGVDACAGVVAVPVTEEASLDPADELSGALGKRSAGAAAPFEIHAAHTLWACGGIGGAYDHSTNYPQLTGDACYIATQHGIACEHLDYVQIHPTGLASPQPGRTFLISESCRGEGAVLLNQAGERFTDELQPRDVVAAAIREDGRDIVDEPIPVVPTQHYFMGGVWVNRDSATSMPGLYAAGETSCNGVHGKNRLASNSLLESLVFARRAAYDMVHGASLGVERAGEPALDGAHRLSDAGDLSIDALCREFGTAVSEPVAYGDAPMDIEAIGAEVKEA